MTTPSLPTPPRPCLTCNQPTTNKGGRCDQHKQQHNQETRFYRSTHWKQLRKLCMQRDGSQCVLCYRTGRLTAHHIKPRKHGGTDDLSNLVMLCHPCHMKAESHDTHVTQSILNYRSIMYPELR